MNPYYEKNKDRIKKYNSIYNKKNKEKVSEIKRKWREKNREKIRESDKIYRKNNPEKIKEKAKRNYIKSKLLRYKLSVQEFNSIFERQNGNCLICNKKMKRVCVDHCHKTNKVRGLLCITCNSGLGMFCDSIKLLKSAIKYLEK